MGEKMMLLKPHQKELFSKDLRRTILLQSLLVFVFAQTLVKSQQSVFDSILAMALFISLTFPVIAAANPELLKSLRKEQFLAQKYFIAVSIFLFIACCAYSMRAAQTSLSQLAIASVWFVCSWILILFLRRRTFPSYLDYLLILLLWLPIESYFLGKVALPAAQVFVQPFMFVGLLLLVYAYLVIRKFNIGYTFGLKGDDFRKVVLNFLLYFFIAIIISIVGGFFKISDRVPSFWQLSSHFVRIFFLIAIPEELLFRGVIYRTLLKQFEGRTFAVGFALLISSVLFGLSKAIIPAGPLVGIKLGLDGVWQAPLANMLLAAVAGMFYGLVFIRTKKITAAATLHLFVEWVWLVFFRS